MSFPLSLRPSRASEQEGEPLFNVLQKIYTERGHLRDITQEALEAEINAAAIATSPSHSSDDEDQKEDDHPLDVDSRAKQVQAARAEMLRLIGQANNEALTALDFVSLLLSKDAPRQAEASISPALKSMAPSGTLGYDKTENSASTKAEEDLEKTMTIGFNFDGLNSTANKLLESATRLELEIARETKYWEQILSLSEKGWNLCRIPGQNHTVGVRYGFSEASPTFRTRGLAALRPDQQGDIQLDQGINSEHKALRIRIVEAATVVQTSHVDSSIFLHDQNLEATVRRARDSLFDEELFFQLLLNARDLFSYGVRVMDNQIILPFQTASQPQRKIVIDLLAGGDGNSSADTSLAFSLALALRLLLSDLFRNRHRLRSGVPPPLTTDSHSSANTNLLLPFLCHMQHHARANELHDSLRTLRNIVQSAKLDCKVKTNQEFIARLTPKNRKSSPIPEAWPMQDIVGALNGALATTISLHLPNKTQLSIKVVTDLSPSVCGTQYHLEQDQTLSAMESSHMTFSDHLELMQFLIVLLRQSIVALLSQKLRNCTPDFDGTALDIANQNGGAEKIVVSFDNDRLALVVSGHGSNGRMALLGVWHGKPRAHGLIELASQRSGA